MKYLYALLAIVLLATTSNAQQVNLNVVVLLDDSGSMGDSFSANRGISKMVAAKQALMLLVNRLPDNTKIGIITFRGWAYNLAVLDKAKVEESLKDVNPNGGTPLGRYMRTAANALLELRDKQKYGTYKLIVITDGESSDDLLTPLSGQYGILSKGLAVEAVGIDMSEKHALATQVPYRNARSFEELKNAVSATVAESTADQRSDDYGTIASLDPHVAGAMLEALSFTDNAPVGSRPMLTKDGKVQYQDGKIVSEVPKVVSGGSMSWPVVLIIVVVCVVLLGIVIVGMASR